MQSQQGLHHTHYPRSTPWTVAEHHQNRFKRHHKASYTTKFLKTKTPKLWSLYFHLPSFDSTVKKLNKQRHKFVIDDRQKINDAYVFVSSSLGTPLQYDKVLTDTASSTIEHTNSQDGAHKLTWNTKNHEGRSLTWNTKGLERRMTEFTQRRKPYYLAL